LTYKCIACYASTMAVAIEGTDEFDQWFNEELTDREREVMRLLAEGMTSREAAMQLKISIRTVESHRINISRKLSFGSVADLVRYAIRNGIIAHV